MALSAAPPPLEPPPNPTTTTAAATTTTTVIPATATTTIARPLFQNPPRPSNPLPFYSPSTRLPSNPNPNYAQLAPRPPHTHPQDPSQLLYPVASSGRGFLHRPVTVPASRPVSRPPLVFPYADPGQGNIGFVRPTYLPHTLLGSAPGSVAVAAVAAPASGTGGVIPGVVKGIPVSASRQPKVALPPVSVSDRLSHADQRNKDDTLAIVRDRKQLQYVDTAKSLPRPLPAAALVFDSPEKDGNKEEGDEEDESVEHLPIAELLQRHVKRAKRVRSRYVAAYYSTRVQDSAWPMSLLLRDLDS
ncbi:formin-like protein 7 [Dorcoceras hygrometricum]|uniref:Formin-like protein 7 n=1 Tax=Dorcoceras hygrometricum TaxID=472368 RepID=A0A2Z7CQX9_9LAMI|nr:formin-like protein 7 [Dorcoceras hygrometricum]